MVLDQRPQQNVLILDDDDDDCDYDTSESEFTEDAISDMFINAFYKRIINIDKQIYKSILNKLNTFFWSFLSTELVF